MDVGGVINGAWPSGMGIKVSWNSSFHTFTPRCSVNKVTQYRDRPRGKTVSGAAQNNGRLPHAVPHLDVSAVLEA